MGGWWVVGFTSEGAYTLRDFAALLVLFHVK